ncbi:MAG: IscS subfamily cysteine desulfurase [Candidatus Omnitrophica bacterium]|nr:IscS subfamily cysteine desulfurase [Candidatus Omnitrophota bacterium]
MSVKLPIFFDHHSTTPVDARVLEAMLPTLKDEYGNASSRSHVFGWNAKRAVDRARGLAAELINAQPEEIIFTSGATESINLAIKGAARMYAEKGRHIVTCVTEHRAVLDTCRALEREGFEITYLPVEPDGRLSPAVLRSAIKNSTILVVIMHANNEIGAIHPIEEIGKITREKGILFFCDATQSVGRIPFDVNKMQIDLACLSAHKIYGPKGSGALYIRKEKPRVRIEPILVGGGHENGLRSGTLNVTGIVGLGAACELAAELMDEESKRMSALRDRLFIGLRNRLGFIHVNGSMEHRLPNNLNMGFEYVESESLLMELGEEIAVSSGSACSSAALEPSHVLKALGGGEEIAHASLRFGLGRFNTEEEVDYVVERVTKAVKMLRAISPLYEMETKLDTERQSDADRKLGAA